MATHVARARPAAGSSRRLRPSTDPAILAGYLEDAAHFPGGRAEGVAVPTSEREVAELVRASPQVLAVGAQSSLTGGATPDGGLVVSTAGLSTVDVDQTASLVRLGAGVPLSSVQAALAARDLYYPPVPTFDGACAGGVASTNAAGAATFKYGTTRDWIDGLTVVLASGDVLALRRGQVRAHPDGYFEFEESARTYRVPVPTYRMPDVAKRSAGYHAEPRMDLVDLFVGAEGTLGIITEVVLRVLPGRPETCTFFLTSDSEDAALELVRRLRGASVDTRRRRDPSGIDVSAIEHMDRRCLALLREDEADRRCEVELPGDSAIALLVQLELPGPLTSVTAYDQIGNALTTSRPPTPLMRACRLFAELDMLERMEIAPPDRPRRLARLLELRESVPSGVNRRIGIAQHTVDPRIEKVAADMIVPFERLPALMALHRETFGRRGLDVAVWGHVSDGNLHPNVIPRTASDVEAGKAAILELGPRVTSLGGCPLAEHGVGRNAVKHALLEQLYGSPGIDEMRRVKRALDPEWKLAPGVLFDPE